MRLDIKKHILILCLSLILTSPVAQSGINDKSYTNGWYWGHQKHEKEKKIQQQSLTTEADTVIKPSYREIIKAIGDGVTMHRVVVLKGP